MKFLYSLGGGTIPVIREFDILSNANIKAGGAVRCGSDNVISHSVIGACLGVAAEDHSGKEDILNQRSNGTKLRIDITKDAVYSVPAQKVTASTTGTNSTFTCPSINLTEGIKNGYVVLVQKGENSENTDSVGTKRKITSISISNNVATFFVEQGGNVSEGDVFAVFPPVGFKGQVSNDNMNFVCTGSSIATSLYVINNNIDNLTLEVLLKKDYFA